MIENCETCMYLGSDSCGGEPEYSVSWPICDKHGNERFSNLKSFPFKKKMTCFVLNFWHSEFADMISGEEKNDDEAFRLYREKYHGEIKTQEELK